MNVPRQPSIKELESVYNLYMYDGLHGGIINKKTGLKVGTKNKKGYITVNLGKKKNRHQYMVHHIVWFLQNKRWPISEIDHRDTVKCNNRENNLIEADAHINRNNYRNCTGSLPGVTFLKYRKNKRYWARLQHEHKKYSLGVYFTEMEAFKAYNAKYKEFYGKDIIL